jgi:broad specificity phosphatase PhoE
MRKFFINSICLLILVGMGYAPVLAGEKSKGSNGTRVFIVRHAEAYKNLPVTAHMSREKRDSLTPEGFKQAKKTGKYLKNRDVAVVVASPTGRTRQTARIIAQEIGLKGVFSENTAFRSTEQGATPDGNPTSWSWRKGQWNAGQDPRPQRGESLQDAVNRAVQAVAALIRQYPERGVVIVTHSDICAGIAGDAVNTPFHQRYQKHGFDLGSVSEFVVYRNGDWVSVP